MWVQRHGSDFNTKLITSSSLFDRDVWMEDKVRINLDVWMEDKVRINLDVRQEERDRRTAD